MKQGRFCQVAFSALDARRLRRWYVEVFGLPASGGTLFGGPPTSRVQGIPRAAEVCLWATDSKALFQLEFFQFLSPKPKEREREWRPSDLGYSIVGFHTTELDAVLSRMRALGSQPSLPIGERGERKAAVQDPEGNWVLLFERDPLAGVAPPAAHPGVRSTLRSVRLSVPDLAEARKVWTESFGLADVTDCVELTTARDESLWGLAGAERDVCIMHGRGMVLELVQYRSPVPSARPVERRICDQGLMNVALGFESARAFDRGLRTAEQHGCRPNGRPLDAGVFKVMYVNEPVNGESVELLFPRPWAYSVTGFAAPSDGGSERRGGVPRRNELRTARSDMWGFETAFISGGGSGIGRRFCELLAGAGADIVVFDLRIGAEARNAILAARRSVMQRIRFIECDVTDGSGLRSAFDAAVDEIGPPDLALNAAGVQLAKAFEDLTDDEYDRVIRVNLLGSRNFARAALPHIGPGGRLGLVASLAGLAPVYNYSAYGASKAGVVGLAGALRLEYAPKGITVCAICPPEVPTPMVDDETKTMHAATRELKKLAGSFPVDETCRVALRELRQGKPIIVPGFRAKAVAALTKMVPTAALDWVTSRVVRRALRSEEAAS